MESNVLTAMFLPLTQAFIMLWMGVNLAVDDFRRLQHQPRATLVGLTAQLLILPALGFLVASLFPLSPEIAVGIVIIAACPGGPMSNLISFMARGDIALSVTLTAFSSVITVFTLPLVINRATMLFLDQSSQVQLPFWSTVAQVAVITLVPISIGMLLKQFKPKVARRADKILKKISLTLVGIVFSAVLLKEAPNFPSYIRQSGAAVLTFNLLAMGMAFAIARLTALSREQSTTLTVEVGVQNTVLAIAIALGPTLLNSTPMSVPAILYATLMLVTGSLFGWQVSRVNRRSLERLVAAPVAVEEADQETALL